MNRPISRYSIRRMLLVIIAMYVNFTFVFKGNEILQYILYYLAMSLFLFFHYPLLRSWITLINEKTVLLKMSAICWCWIFIMAIVVPIIYETYDFSYVNVILGIIRQLISQLFVFLLIYRTLGRKYILDKYINISTLSGCLYVFFSCVMFVFPSFKDFWLNIIAESYGIGISAETFGYFTRYGLAGFSGFNVTIVFSVLVLLQLICLKKIQIEHGKVSLKTYFTLFILLLGNSFYGRSGLLVSLALIGLFLIFSKKIKIIVYIIAFLIIVFLGVNVLRDYNTQINEYYIWSMTPLINLIEDGSFGKGSGEIMLDMYFTPSIGTFLVGDGRFISESGEGYYMGTDVGFMRSMLFYGVFNQSIGYFIALTIIFGVRKYMRGLGNFKDFYTLGAIISIFAFEFKGEAFFRLMGFFFIMLLSFALYRQEIEYSDKEMNK